MTNEESKKPENTEENVEEGVKKFSDKASDAFENITEGAKKVGEKAGDTLGDIAGGAKKAGEKASDVVDAVITGMKRVGEKATETVEILGLKREISQLKSANKKIKPKISDAVLALYAEKNIKEPSLVEFCEETEKNNELIEEKKAQIEVINKSEAE
jgi:hypothetical protein